MKSIKFLVLSILTIVFAVLHFSFKERSEFVSVRNLDSLRNLYTQPIANWPAPTLDIGAVFEEFKALPELGNEYFALMQQPKVVLGKLLFFDPILSGSNQISCSSCHNPQTSWGDKISVPVGNNHEIGKRNTISLLNVAARKTLFWDGRATTLEEQAISPIEAHNEMAMDSKALASKLNNVKAYKKLFKDAYGTDDVTIEKITESLAIFQRTLTSKRSRFDKFLDGDYKALNNQEVEGLHLFRTKARCINCHNGQYFTDESFHNVGMTYYKRKYEDLGRFEITKNPDDVGKFRTPSLRDVMNTSPWMHNGLFDNITGVVNFYNSGMQMVSATPEQKIKDPNYPVTDPLMKKLDLSRDEIQSVVAFLNAITAPQYKMPRPDKLPRD